MKQNTKDDGYVIFALTHPGFFFNIIALATSIYKDRKKILVYSVRNIKESALFNLVNNGFFSDAIYYTEFGFLKYKNNDTIESKILDYFDNIIRSNGYSPREIEEICCGSDLADTIVIWGGLRNIYTTLFEPDEGFFLRASSIDRYAVATRILGLSLEFEEISRKYGILDGGTKNVSKRYVWKMDSKSIGGKDTVFDFNDYFFNMEDDLKELFVDSFELTAYKDTKWKTAFFLPSITNSCEHLGLKDDRSDFPILLSLFNFADYFLNSDASIILKRHPFFKFRNGYDPSQKISNSIPQMDPLIPIEFFFLVKGFDIESMLLFSNSIGSKISDKIPKQIQLTFQAISGWNKLAGFCLTDKLLTALSRDGFTVHSKNKRYIEKYNEYRCDNKYHISSYEKDADNGEVVIYDDLSKDIKRLITEDVRNASDDTILIFIDPDDHFRDCFPLQGQFTDSLVIKHIHYEKTRKDSLLEKEGEYLYVYCRDESVRKTICDINITKELNLTGALMWTETIQDYRDYSYQRIVEDLEDQKKKTNTILGLLQKGETSVNQGGANSSNWNAQKEMKKQQLIEKIVSDEGFCAKVEQLRNGRDVVIYGIGVVGKAIGYKLNKELTGGVSYFIDNRTSEKNCLDRKIYENREITNKNKEALVIISLAADISEVINDLGRIGFRNVVAIEDLVK